MIGFALGQRHTGVQTEQSFVFRVKMIVGFVEYEGLDVVHRSLNPVRQPGGGFPDQLFEVG